MSVKMFSLELCYQNEIKALLIDFWKNESAQPVFCLLSFSGTFTKDYSS